MLLIDLVQFIVQAQAPCADPNQMCTISCLDQNAMCPASAFNAIAAAFATEGYWVQDHLIHYLVDTGMGLWAPLLYIVAAIGGLASLAMGSPPRTYMWFFMGPAFYAWLLDTRDLASGVEWRVGDYVQDQREVWKLAEAGLRNSGTFHDVDWIHTGVRIYKDKPPGGGSLPSPNSRYSNPGMYANVATFFLWFDELISDTVQQMTQWVGAFHQLDNTAVGNETNLIPKPATPDVSKNKWYLMSNSKWEYLTNITDAKAHSAELRDAFVTFLSSECGDLLKRSIDSARLIAVSNAKGKNIDFGTTIMLKDASGDPYNYVTRILMSQTIPTPRAMVKLLSDDSRGSFRDFANLISSGGVSAWGIREKIACDQYLFLLVHALRWEAGHTTAQIIAAGPNNMLPSGIIWSLFYGWDLRDWTVPGGGGNPTPGAPLDYADQVKFLENMVLVHLIRNEFAAAPALTDQRYATAEKALNYTLAYQRSVGQKSKWAEVYTWAMMIPYLQGVLLYLLAIAYPFACIVILVPGMHKSILTWMSFWAWVKLWDLGFAIVVVLERSIWAMVGNNSNASRLLGLIEQMSSWGSMQIDCTGPGSGLPGGGGGIIPDGGDQISACPVPKIVHVSASGAIGNIQEATAWVDAMRIFDRAMVLGANLDFDLANSYYIYIMAALYFAVPTVTGQLVLGARAGAAGMVNTALGGVSQESGKMAGSGYGSEAVTHMHANMASVGQSAYAKSMRQSGLGMQAIEYGNQGMREEMSAGALGTASSNLGLMKDQYANTNQSRQFALDAIANQAGLLGSGLRMGGRGVDRALGALGLGSTSLGGGSALTGPSGGANPRSTMTGGSTSQAENSGAELFGSGNVGAGRLPDGNDPPGVPSQRSMALENGGTGPSTGSANSGQTSAARSPTGSSPDSQVGATENRGGTGARIGNALAGALDAAVKPLVAAGRNQSAQNMLGDISNLNGMLADMHVGSFGHGQAAKGYGQAAQRTGQYAAFEAQQAEWEAKNAYAHQITGQAVAMGHFVGGMSAGNKPTAGAEAMAMSGMLNTNRQNAKAAANWVMPGQRGGFFDAASNTSGQLNSDYGGNRVRAAYSSSTPLEAGIYAGKAEATLVQGTLAEITGAGKHTHGGGRSGDQVWNDTRSGTARTGMQGDAGRGSELTRGTLEAIGVGDGVGDGAGRGQSPNPGHRGESPVDRATRHSR